MNTITFNIFTLFYLFIYFIKFKIFIIYIFGGFSSSINKYLDLSQTKQYL